MVNIFVQISGVKYVWFADPAGGFGLHLVKNVGLRDKWPPTVPHPSDVKNNENALD